MLYEIVAKDYMIQQVLKKLTESGLKVSVIMRTPTTLLLYFDHTRVECDRWLSTVRVKFSRL